MSRRRLAVLLALALAGLVTLTGCRTSPAVAAYVGADRISVDALTAAVDERLADPGIAAFAAGDRVSYARQVLSLQVAERVHDAAARRYGVQVSDADVQERITTLLAGADPAPVFGQLAQQQGVNAEDVRENVRQQLVRQRIAAAAGKADLSDAALEKRYVDTRNQLATVQLGVITVPNQATADAVLARLRANPASYPALAAQHAGSNTLPAPRSFGPGELGDVLAAPVAATPPGQGFTLPVPEAGGVVVGFVVGSTVPPFAEVREKLAQQAGSDADDAGTALVGAVRDGLHITVNPRYGVLEEGKVVAGSGGVVRLLEDAGSAAARSSGN